MAGLVVDGAAQLQARQHAQDAASQVARYAMDAAAPYLVDGRSGSSAALKAAGQAAKGYGGIAFVFSVDAAGALHVNASTTVPTIFLRLIGIQQLKATGQAIATVVQP